MPKKAGTTQWRNDMFIKRGLAEGRFGVCMIKTVSRQKILMAW